MTDGTARRRPGRPRKPEHEHQQARSVILAATAEVFTEHRYADVTVTRIIERAGITRAAFYRYFRNAEAPLRVVVEQACAALVADVHRATDPGAGSTDPDAAARRVVAGLNAYLDWSGRYPFMVAAMVVDGHDESSPVHPARREIVDTVTTMLAEGSVASGRPRPAPGTLAVFVNTIEYICHRLRSETAQTPADVEESTDLMLRIAVALLGSPRTIQRLADSRAEAETRSEIRCR